MDEPLVYSGLSASFFRSQVEQAMEQERIQAGELTSYYLVDLLQRFIRPDARIPFADHSDKPLALRLGEALESNGLEQRARLRNLGDFSLFMSGFFSDSLRRRAVDVDYYISMGEYAYGSLAHRDQDAFGEVFLDLSQKFVAFMDVLASVSEHCRITTDMDVLRLYERWLRTGSVRDGRKLARRGIAPNATIGSRFIQ